MVMFEVRLGRTQRANRALANFKFLQEPVEQEIQAMTWQWTVWWNCNERNAVGPGVNEGGKQREGQSLLELWF